MLKYFVYFVLLKKAITYQEEDTTIAVFTGRVVNQGMFAEDIGTFYARGF